MGATFSGDSVGDDVGLRDGLKVGYPSPLRKLQVKENKHGVKQY